MGEQTQPTSQASGAMRKMALTETERKLVEDHRRKTAGDREFNAGLDHALEVLPLAVGDYLTTQADRDEINDRLSGWRQAISAARRDV